MARDTQRRVAERLPGRRHPTPGRVAENHRPPRYRLLAAAAALPERPAPELREEFERNCPTCGRVVVFTVVSGRGATQYLIEDHPCT